MSFLYINALYDYYGAFLTDKQKVYFEEYYFENLTLAEISENHEVSRNAVHKQIKEAESKLLHFEEQLQLHEKRIKIETLLEQVEQPLREQIKELI